MVELYREGKTIVLEGKPVSLPPYTRTSHTDWLCIEPGSLWGKNGTFL
jgi:hypothetical protein